VTTPTAQLRKADLGVLGVLAVQRRGTNRQERQERQAIGENNNSYKKFSYYYHSISSFL